MLDSRWQGGKKFVCIRCGYIDKRHDYLDLTKALCRTCEAVVGYEAQEAIKLLESRQPIPERLDYLFTSGHIKYQEV